MLTENIELSNLSMKDLNIDTDVTRRLGHGSFSQVCLAKHVKNEKLQFAVKIVGLKDRSRCIETLRSRYHSKRSSSTVQVRSPEYRQTVFCVCSFLISRRIKFT